FQCHDRLPAVAGPLGKRNQVILAVGIVIEYRNYSAGSAIVHGDSGGRRAGINILEQNLAAVWTPGRPTQTSQDEQQPRHGCPDARCQVEGLSLVHECSFDGPGPAPLGNVRWSGACDCPRKQPVWQSRNEAVSPLPM